MLRIIPDKVATALALELRKATSVQDMQSTINIYIYIYIYIYTCTTIVQVYQEAYLALMICTTELGKQTESPTEEQTDNKQTQQTNKADAPSEDTINAATKGSRNGEND